MRKYLIVLAVFLTVPALASATQTRSNVPLERMANDACFIFSGKTTDISSCNDPSLKVLGCKVYTVVLDKIVTMCVPKADGTEWKSGDKFTYKVATAVKGNAYPRGDFFQFLAKPSRLGLTAPINLSEGVLPVQRPSEGVSLLRLSNSREMFLKNIKNVNLLRTQMLLQQPVAKPVPGQSKAVLERAPVKVENDQIDIDDFIGIVKQLREKPVSK